MQRPYIKASPRNESTQQAPAAVIIIAVTKKMIRALSLLSLTVPGALAAYCSGSPDEGTRTNENPIYDSSKRREICSVAMMHCSTTALLLLVTALTSCFCHLKNCHSSITIIRDEYEYVWIECIAVVST